MAASQTEHCPCSQGLPSQGTSRPVLRYYCDSVPRNTRCVVSRHFTNCDWQGSGSAGGKAGKALPAADSEQEGALPAGADSQRARSPQYRNLDTPAASVLETPVHAFSSFGSPSHTPRNTGTSRNLSIGEIVGRTSPRRSSPRRAKNLQGSDAGTGDADVAELRTKLRRHHVSPQQI